MLLEAEEEEGLVVEEEEVDLLVKETTKMIHNRREKTQQNPPSLRGSSSRSWKQGNQRYDKYKVQFYYYNKFGHYANKYWKKKAYVGK
jgi:hypothetical protein